MDHTTTPRYCKHQDRLTCYAIPKVNKRSEKTKYPIYTLGIPGKKLYVVASPHLVSQVDHNAKAISFDPFLALFVQRIIAPSREAMCVISEGIDNKGTPGFRQESMKTIHSNVSMGEALEGLTQSMLKSLIPQLRRPNVSEPDNKVQLFKWTKRVVSRASTDSVYGPQNPFHDDAVAESFWSVDSYFASLGLDIFPKWTARKGALGRDRLSDAFFKYYSNGGHLSASHLVRARYDLDRKYGFGIEDTARFELSICIGLLVNIVPTTFWCLCFIYQRPALLEELRAGLSESITIHEEVGMTSYHVDFTKILTSFPLLSACIREALRVLSTNAAGRVIMKDTWLDNQYFLKKDSMLLIPSAELHNDPGIWGNDYKNFNPHRWLDTEREKAPVSAYRAFGGGSWPCPGRNFSSNEMSAALVMIILQYDLSPSAGFWKTVKAGFHISTSVRTPQEDIEVDLRCRQGYEHVNWKFLWRGVQI